MSNISQIVNVDKNMSILLRGVMATGLNKMLSESCALPLFAPSDKAYDKLEKEVVEGMLQPENNTSLMDVLNLHVVAGKIHLKDLKDGEKLKTMNGRELHVQVKEGVILVDGAKVLGNEVQASNGLIYALDTVMMKN